MTVSHVYHFKMRNKQRCTYMFLLRFCVGLLLTWIATIYYIIVPYESNLLHTACILPSKFEFKIRDRRRIISIKIKKAYLGTRVDI